MEVTSSMRRADRIRAGARNKIQEASKKRNASSRRGKSLSPTHWHGKMKGVPCFLMGNSPSLGKIDNLPILDEFFSIGINRIFFKYDPTILIWQDLALWSQERDKVISTKAIKYCREGAETQGGFYAFMLNGREPKMTNDVSKLYGRGSSGTIAYQFAHVLGCDPIILLGMDCRYSKNGNTDFYGKNSMHRAHTLPACRKGLEFINNNSKDRTIINCSKSKVFSDRKTIEEAISMLGEKRYSREELVNMLK